jgi:hypothetical protein
LKVAAVIGREIDLRLLACFTPAIDAWLQACADAAVLEVSDQAWRFAHDKLRETLLGGLPLHERRELHRTVAQAMLKVYGGSEDMAAALAYHFEQAGDAALAAEHAMRAGLSAVRRGALHEAAELLQRTIALQVRLNAPALQQGVTLRFLARVQYGVGQVQECLETTRTAMRRLGQPLPPTRAQRRVAILREIAAEARARLFGPEPIANPEERARMHELLALATGTGETFFVAKGRLDEAILVYLRGLHLAERLGDATAQTNYLSIIAYAAAMLPARRLSRYFMERARQQLLRLPADAAQTNYHLVSGILAAAQGTLAAEQRGPCAQPDAVAAKSRRHPAVLDVDVPHLPAAADGRL